jgi:integrase
MRKFPREYMEKYPSVKKVYDAIAGPRRLGSERTTENYINYVAKFVDYLGFKDPETALQAMLSGQVNAGEKIDKFIDYALEKLDKAHNSVRGYVFAVKKWFELNGVKVDWARIEMPTGTETRENDRAPTKEDLKRLLKHASSSRDRAIIYCDTSSGLRINTLLGLKVGDVDFGCPDIARFTVERKRGRKFGSKRGPSAGKLFVTFITPEAKEALKQYLEERKIAGENITSESPLFGDAYHKGRFLTIDAYGRVWVRLLQRAGLAKKSNNWYELHIHTLRKYFRSNCVGVDPSYREKWMGHKGLYLDMSYFRAEELLHIAEYRKAIPFLTIQEVQTDQKKLQNQMMVAFAKMQGYSDDKIKRLEEVLQRAKDINEAADEFRKLKDEEDPTEETNFSHVPDGDSASNSAKNGRHIIVKGEKQLLSHLNAGWRMIEKFEDDKFLMRLR